jgi:hypothetical protein
MLIGGLKEKLTTLDVKMFCYFFFFPHKQSLTVWFNSFSSINKLFLPLYWLKLSYGNDLFRVIIVSFWIGFDILFLKLPALFILLAYGSLWGHFYWFNYYTSCMHSTSLLLSIGFLKYWVLHRLSSLSQFGSERSRHFAL